MNSSRGISSESQRETTWASDRTGHSLSSLLHVSPTLSKSPNIKVFVLKL